MKKFFARLGAGVLILAFIVIAIPYLYIQFKIVVGGFTLDIYDAPSSDRYYSHTIDDYHSMLLTLTSDGKMIIDNVGFDAPSPYMTYTVYDIGSSEYPQKILKDYYATGDTIFSIRKAKKGTVPLITHMKALTYEEYECSSKKKIVVGKTYDGFIFISDDCVYIDDDKFVRVTSIPAEIKLARAQHNIK